VLAILLARSFAAMLGELATVPANKVRPIEKEVPSVTVVATPIPIQQRAFDQPWIPHRLR